MNASQERSSDRTEDRGPDSALPLTQAQLTDILDNLSVPLYIVDQHWRIIYLNHKAEELWARPGQRLLGLDLWEEFPHAIGIDAYHQLVAAMQERRAVRFEYHSPSVERWLEMHAEPSGAGLVVYFHDINDRKHAEEALRESEEKYRTLFDSIDEGFCMVEVIFNEEERPIDYRFLDTNLAFEQQSGIENAVGRRMREIAPLHEQHWFDIYGRVALTGQAVRFEQRAEQLRRFYDVYAFRIGEPARRRVGILFNDITNRKRAETRQTYLLKLADTLRPLTDPNDIKAAATRLLGEYVATDRVVYAEYVRKDQQDYFLIENVYHVPEYTFPSGLAPVSSFGRDGYEVVKGKTIVINDVASDTGISPEAQETFKAINVRAYVALPLMKEGTFVALLALNQVTPREWKPEELDLLQETAERTWAAMERARAEAALRESEERFRLLVEGARDYAMFLLDPENCITFWSVGAERLFGWSEAEVCGQSGGIIFTREDRDCGEVQREIRTAVTQGRAEDRRWHVRKDGTRLFVDGVLIRLDDPGGQLRGFVKIGRDATAQRQAQEALQDAHAQLEQRVVVRTAELATANQSLQQEIGESRLVEVQRAALLERVITAQEDERRRIALELHDSLGQFLAALMIRISALQATATSLPEVTMSLADLQKVASQIERELDRLTMELRPPGLDDLGLVQSLREYVEEWSATSGITVEMLAPGQDQTRLPAALETTVYRIVQEALTNVLKYAQASQVSIILEQSTKRLRVIIEDNGQGFDIETVARERRGGRHLGLVGMSERASLVGGTVTIESQPGSGTTIYLYIPLPGALPENAEADHA